MDSRQTPTASLLMSNRGVNMATCWTRPATGYTLRAVPTTINKSHTLRSLPERRVKVSGSGSPKKTMSGRSGAPQVEHAGACHASPCSYISSGKLLGAVVTGCALSAEQRAREALPWHSTMSFAGTPASLSRPSMFCVYTRCSTPATARRARSECRRVGLRPENRSVAFLQKALGSAMKPCGEKRSRVASCDQRPMSDLKSGMPAAVEAPAPTRTTTR
mmetsp:Transcript_6448/g.17975  ORF Transcript_6448/g.17975 Transcript_6448/m.17975 type:complete len:218 (-) Transcript_6448:1398-2051(-)